MSETAISLGGRTLQATLQIPRRPSGIVAFVHGSGVDRHDARDRCVAEELLRAGFATLQPELLEPQQAAERHDVFDSELQCARLLEAVLWLDQSAWAKALPLGFFGCGIGAGVALLAAAKRPERPLAVVCRGGRPDSALFWAPRVRAATLLLVEEDGWPYREVYEALTGAKKLVVVPTESHLFDEPAARDEVAQQARRWFSRYLLTSSPIG
jgi:putative phosphoribosyl transferase